MSALPLILFWALGIIWGSNFIYMKLASELISVPQIVLLRVAFGFIPVLVIVLVRGGMKLSHFRHTGHFFVMSILGVIAYYYGFAKGTSLLLSGVAGALSATTPIFSFLLAIVFLADEKATANRVLGICIGFVGVLMIARPFTGDLTTIDVTGILYTMMGSIGVGASFVYARKFLVPLKIPAVVLTTYQLGLGLLLLSLFTDKTGIGNIWTDIHVAAALVVGLGLLGTGAAFIMYFYIIEKLGAVSSSSVAYIPPVVALIIGAVIVGEDIILIEYIATATIFAGVYLINIKKVVASR